MLVILYCQFRGPLKNVKVLRNRTLPNDVELQVVYVVVLESEFT